MSLLSRLAVQAARAYGILSSKSTNVSANFLVVAGGAGGGGNLGGLNGTSGGGGAGGYRTSAGTSGGGASAESALTLSTLNTYAVTVGAGGAGITNCNVQGAQGSNSVFSTITSTGGGGGAANAAGQENGVNGGSGGGGVFNGTKGNGTSSQGYDGGVGNGTNGGGGGGGASAVGGNGTSSVSGNGGGGVASSISGSSVTYAGGGGGGGSNSVTRGTGGSGGGGNGGPFKTSGSSGTANTGGGGGGMGAADGTTGFSNGSGGSGIVIISYASATPRFVGGTLTTSGGNQIHTFTSSGTLSPLTPVTASYLVVAGGGGGGGATTNQGGGGGGAGGLLTSSTTLYSGATYVVTVGAGGTGGVYGGAAAGAGSNSVVSGTGLTTLTSTGGGGGGVGPDTNGSAGGSGGGGGSGGTLRTGGTGTVGQGNNGGQNNGSANFAAAGGGGAGAVGGDGGSVGNGNGGNGSASSISGSSVTYAGGGGAGKHSSAAAAGTGGTGGGGAGGSSSVGVPGTTNLGGGGGGGSSSNVGGAGGSGTVIISYAGSQVFNGGLVTSSGGNTIHTFNATGALTPLTNNLTNSLRFRASAGGYLNRTPTVAGNRRTWTLSAWIKRGALSSSTSFGILEGNASSTELTAFRFGSDNLSIQDYSVSNGYNLLWTTTAVYRDPSAWYHIVISYDSTQASSANTVKMFVNGNQQIVTFLAAQGSYSQNRDSYINAINAQRIGVYNGLANYFDGYMDDINLIDGQALEPYYFGNNDANGVWKPIKYTGMYGTNGFYLTFADTTSTTTLGYDSSGNNNNWTTNNISLTAGTTYDAMTDVPTNTSATVANYAVMNPLNKDSGITVTQANLQATGSTGDVDRTVFSTMSIPSSQKIYFEAVAVTGSSAGNYFAVGIAPSTLGLSQEVGISGSFGIESNQASDSLKRISGTFTSYGAGTYIATNDIIQVAIDQASGKIWFGKNNTWFDSGNPSSGTNPATSTLSTSTEYFPVASFFRSGPTLAFNFGQRPFAYTPPTGFVALNTFNLPTPTILQGNKYMDATLWSGTGVSGLSITNAALFKPDLVWMKGRNLASQNNVLVDSVRGANQTLLSNTTDAQAAISSIAGFNSNGFVISGTANNGYSGGTSGLNYVAWQWQAGQGSTSSNTSGSITSTVSVNATAGFSVVTYTGNGSSGATFGHGLGVAPRMVIVKIRNTTDNWRVGHAFMNGGTNPWNYNLTLNQTNAQQLNSTVWNNTAPTSTLVTLGNDSSVNASSSTYVAYCWAEIAGFSAFGSYTGNASTDGPFVYLGFRPKFVIFRDYSNAHSWILIDSSRNTYNVAGDYLRAESSAVENATYSVANNTAVDFLSNGFKLRNAAVNSGENNGSSNYIYMAWAENPFKNANAR